MKIFVFLLVAFFYINASAITITAVRGTSNDINFNGPNAPVFMAGISGSNLCHGQITTVNTCHMRAERAACNFKTVCPSTLLEITFTAKTSGRISLMDISNYPIYDLGNYTAGTIQTVQIPWSEICHGLASDPTCQVITRGVLRLGIDSGGNYQPEESSSHIFQVSGIENNRWDPQNDKLESLSTSHGVDNYTLQSGDKKAFVKEFSTLNLYIGEAARITAIRAFFAPTTCQKVSQNPTAVNTTHSSQLIPLSDDQKELTSNVFEGLENNVNYAFMIGVQDQAGNIGMFKDLHTQCVEGQHTVTPKAL